MVKTLGLDKNGVKKGAWSEEEDEKLRAYIQRYGHWNWSLLPKFAGLSRSGKSCRLRWVNYLRPDMKHGNFTREEDDLIVHLHSMLGNKWSAIAAKLPGRSDNEIKNRWNTYLKKHSQYDHIVQESNHHAAAMEPADQANQKEHTESEVQNGGEMNLVGSSSVSPSCSTLTELSSCWLNGADCGVSSNVDTQTFDYQLLEDFWTESFLEDITSSVDSIMSPSNAVGHDLITQSSSKDIILDDELSWSMMLDSCVEYNNEFMSCWDRIQ